MVGCHADRSGLSSYLPKLGGVWMGLAFARRLGRLALGLACASGAETDSGSEFSDRHAGSTARSANVGLCTRKEARCNQQAASGQTCGSARSGAASAAAALALAALLFLKYKLATHLAAISLQRYPSATCGKGNVAPGVLAPLRGSFHEPSDRNASQTGAAAPT